MNKNNNLGNFFLEEEARIRRMYNPNPQQNTPCPAIKFYQDSKKTCQHTEIIKKHLFTTSYNVCKDCGEEV